mgnify:CR=1 FL=1
MANVSDSVPMDARFSARAMMRAGLFVLAIILAIQAIWILYAEAYRLNRDQPLMGSTAGTIARADQERAFKAASLAFIRGDLWAESAIAYAGQIGTDRASLVDPNDPQKEKARVSMLQTLRYSPHRGDIWLLLAAAADRNGWQGFQPGALIKVSYYTAPNETALFPLRLATALQLKNGLGDEELRELVRRDIRIILTHDPALKPALAQAYKTASAAGKMFLEQTISEIDPSYVSVVRTKLP